MYETEDLCGRQFGELKVSALHNRSPNGGASWLCRCSCGRTCSVGGKALIKGHKRNCGDCNFGHYFFYSDYVECVLPTGERFQIDVDDYPIVSRYKWVTNKAGYFVASIGMRDDHVFLHRLVMDPPEDAFVDHIDCNKSNCCKSNLRICSQTENNRNVGLQQNNRCGFKGVYWASDRGKWRAEITVDRKHIHLGSFDSAIEAAKAYDKAAVQHFGAFAKTNEMLGNYDTALSA